MSDQSPIALVLKLDTPYDQAVELVSQELEKVGFGILTRIDVHKVIKKNLVPISNRMQYLGRVTPT
jgi:uncharacterized protein (DUF302 family)